MEFLNSVNKISIAILVAAIGLGLYKVVPEVMPTYENIKTEHRLKSNVESDRQELEGMKETAARKHEVPETTEKVIYQSQGLQIGADASFATLFEDVIEIAKNSGIRIRSINYVYQPPSDPIVSSNLGYNVCELNIVAVGTYTEFQNFYKNVLREHYLTYFAEIEVKPWESDKSVLITTMKLRLYTKTS